MKATYKMASLAILAALCLFGTAATPVCAQDPAAGGGSAPKYTMAEYNAYQAAASEKDPATQIRLLDDFVSKYPASSLLNYVYPLYYRNYAGQKNFPKTIQYVDKYVALGDAATTPGDRYQAYSIRAYAYNNIPNPEATLAKGAYDASLAGVKAVDGLPKPEGYDDAKFAEEKKKAVIGFYSTAGNAAVTLKDYPNAVKAYKAVLALSPDEFITNYNLGKAYSAMTPPQTLDAIWSFARAATSKTATEPQSKSVKTYLRKVVSNYQGGTVCDPLTDSELNELYQLAATSVDRPASYQLFSSADLDTARKDMTIASVVTDLKSGGDKSKVTWAAVCGADFPDVPGKILEVTATSDGAVMKTAFVTSDAEFEAASTPNMEWKVAGQPEAAKLEKGNPVRVSGTLASYDPDPAFMLHWDKAKVNAEDLPKEKAAPKKPPVRKPVPKKP